MTVAPPNLPSTYAWGFVTGQVIRAVADTAVDEDRYPESKPAIGKVRFDPAEKLRKVVADPPAIVVNETVSVNINDQGELVDNNDLVGVWLVTGDYRVSFQIDSAEIPAFYITVTADHTLESPLDLAVAAPYMPPTGVVVRIPDVKTRYLTLENATVVSTTGWPLDISVAQVVTQDSSGNHALIFDGEFVDVNLAPNSETVIAWVYTGTTWRWYSDAVPGEVVVDETPPTAGNLQLSAAPTDIVATSVAAMDDVALHPQPYRFAIATTAASSGWSDVQWEAAMGAWQASATATLTGLTMGTAYSARCQVRDVAGNMRMTAVVNATTTVVVDPVTIYEATFTAPDGTLLSAYTPEVGGPGTLGGGPGQIFGGGLWTIANPANAEWQSSPSIFLTSAASQKLVRFTFDYDYTAADNYGTVWFELNKYRGFGLGKMQGILSGGGHGGTMVSSEVSPTAPTIPVAGRAMFEFEGTPGVMSNWTNRAYIFVDDEPVLHTTEVITGSSAANNFQITVASSYNGGEPGVTGTKLNSAKIEGVPQ